MTLLFAIAFVGMCVVVWMWLLYVDAMKQRHADLIALVRHLSDLTRASLAQHREETAHTIAALEDAKAWVDATIREVRGETVDAPHSHKVH